MGLLSRRRKVPRIVKKVKSRVGRKKISIKQLDPNIRKHWDNKLSVHENFEHIGLKLDLNPNMKTSKEGRKTMHDAQKFFGQVVESEDEKDPEAEEGSDAEFDDVNKYLHSDDEDDSKTKKKSSKPVPDLNKVFKLKNTAEVKYEETHKKLNMDDVSMMKQLIRKYGDNFSAMFRDIKTNFMQYSKGQLKSKYKSYFFYGHDKK
jgi:nucleolar protein 16